MVCQTMVCHIDMIPLYAGFYLVEEGVGGQKNNKQFQLDQGVLWLHHDIIQRNREGSTDV